jgi:hypothetical protein
LSRHGGRIEPVNTRRGLLLVVLLYVTLDFSLPDMPGAFEFDPAGCVESVEAARGRVASEVIVLPAPAAGTCLEWQVPRGDLRHRLVSTEFSVPRRAPMVHLPRATAASSSSPTEDPH